MNMHKLGTVSKYVFLLNLTWRTFFSELAHSCNQLEAKGESLSGHRELHSRVIEALPDSFNEKFLPCFYLYLVPS